MKNQNNLPVAKDNVIVSSLGNNIDITRRRHHDHGPTVMDMGDSFYFFKLLFRNEGGDLLKNEIDPGSMDCQLCGTNSEATCRCLETTKPGSIPASK